MKNILIYLMVFLCPLLSFSTSIIVNDIEFQITHINPSIPNSGKISLNINNSGVSPYHIVWTGPGGFSKIYSNSQTIEGIDNLSAPGEYCVMLMDGNNCAASGCVELMMVENNCTGNCISSDFSHEFQNGDNQTIDFTDESTSDNPPITSWSWNFGDGAISDEQHPTHYYNLPNTNSSEICYEVSLEITDSGGNIDQHMEQVCIPVFSNSSELIAEISSCPEVAGAGQSVAFSGNAIGGIPPYTFSWNFNSLGNPTPESATGAGPHNVIYEDPGSLAVFLTVTDANGNSDTESCTVDVVSNPGNSVISTSGLSCVGNPTYFEVDLPPPYQFSGALTYDWDFGDGNIAQYAGPYWEHTYSSAGTYDVTFTIYDSYGSYSYYTTVEITDCTPPPSTPFILTVNGQTDNIVINSGDSPDVEFEIVATGNENPDDWCFTLTTGNSFTNGFSEYTQWSTPYIKNHSYNGWYTCNYVSLFMRKRDLQQSCTNPFMEYFALEYPCYVRVEYEPLEIEDIVVTTTSSPQCTPVLKVLANKGLRRAGNSNNICGETAYYKEYLWKAYDANNPTQEIDELFPNNQFFISSDDKKCVSVNLEHPYFDQFNYGEIPYFIAKVGVSDYENNLEEYGKLIYINPAPVQILLEDEYHICTAQATNDINLYDNFDWIVGGSGNFSVDITGTGTGVDFVLVNVTGTDMVTILPTAPPGAYGLEVEVTDNGSGCTYFEAIDLFITDNISVEFALPGFKLYSKMCAGTPGDYNQMELNITGGSGDYTYSWTPTEYLDDPTSATPEVMVPLSMNGSALTFNVEVTDNQGSCLGMASHEFTFEVPQFEVDAGLDLTICNGEEITLGNNDIPEVIPVTTPFGFIVYYPLWYYRWTSDNPHFEDVFNEPNISLNNDVTQFPGTFTFEVQGVSTFSGCVLEDQVEVTVGKPWLYEGYESKSHNGFLNQIVLAWDDSNENKLYSSLPNPDPTSPAPYYYNANSGAVGPFIYGWKPSDVITTLGVNNVPTQAEFILGEDLGYRTLIIEDQSTGCTKEFKTNRYFPITDDPDIIISSDASPIACLGDEVCFDVKLHYHYGGQGNPPLPNTIPITANIPSNGSTHNLQLIDNEIGIYKTTICKQFNSAGFFTMEVEYEYEVSNFAGSSVQTIAEELEIKVASEPIFGVTPTHCVSGEIFSGAFKGMGVVVAPPNGLSTCTSSNNNTWWATIMPVNSQVLFIGGDHVMIQTDFLDEPNAGWSSTPQISSHAFISPCFYPNQNLVENDSAALLIQSMNQQTGIVSKDKTQKVILSDIDLNIIPNPFNDEIEISYTISEEESSKATLIVNDITGKQIKLIFDNKLHEKGEYKITMNTDDLQPGVYFYHLTVNNQRVVKKAIKVN